MKTKLFSMILVSSLVFISGCSYGKQETLNSDTDMCFGIKECEDMGFFEYMDYKEEQDKTEKKKACEQENIPAKYAKDCYLLKFDYCKSDSEAMIPKDELEACAPIFIKEIITEEIENTIF